ncbi:MAG: hypothetical protein ACLTQF_13085 [Lachnospira sp.]
MKVTLRFRGREMAHMYKSKHILDDFAESLTDIAVVDKALKDGRKKHGYVFNCKTLK